MDALLGQAYVPKHFRNGERPPDSSRGDPAGAFDTAAVRLDATYITPIEHHNPMEPHATIAAWDGDKLTVWTATQGISGAQRTLAGQFGTGQDRRARDLPLCRRWFRLQGQHLAAGHARRYGGAHRPTSGEAGADAGADVHLQRLPSAHRAKVAAGGRDRWRLLAIRHDGISSMSQPKLGEFVEPVALATEMLYTCPNVAITHRLVALNAPLPTYMRAPGESSGVFALESAMDEMAVALKLDPIELRLRNYAETDPHESKPFASKALRACYEQGARAFGWIGGRRSRARCATATC